MTTERSIDVGNLISGVKAHRNRAVDFYKATAMIAVAFGHWMAIAVTTLVWHLDLKAKKDTAVENDAVIARN